MKKFFSLLLFVTVLISYGQILLMYVWQDDNGLFFKLAHISERAGYLGPGPFGAGAYKYIATPYILVYKFFGYNTVPYFLLALVCYFLTTIVIYKVVSKILGEKAGKISSFLWAAGFVASDGFIRLFNTVITSLSVVLISLLTFSYWRFYKDGKYKWYFLALLSYFLATEFAIGRTHYLISVVILFELLFLAFRKPISTSILKASMRVTPFLFIFYHYFIVNADARSANIGKLVAALIRGEYYQLYGFLSSVSNLTFPDWIVSHVFQLKQNYVWVAAIVFFIFVVVKAFRKKTNSKFLMPIVLAIFFVWVFVSRGIFLVPVLNLGTLNIFTAFLGGSVVIFSLAYFFVIDNKFRKLYLLFLFWCFINIGAYSAYNPTVAYETVNRYLAHSFFALVLIGGVIYQASKRKKVVLTVLVLWGVMNVVGSVLYQNNIVRNRSIPPRNFYNELKAYLPKIEKGDVIYFDVNQDARNYFADAFSVASMPETTAIAWRYGVDRYDFTMFTDFSKMSSYVQTNKIDVQKVHSFWYAKSGLVDTTSELRRFILQGKTNTQVDYTRNGNDITFKEPISSIVPIHLLLEIAAKPEFISSHLDTTLDNNFKNMAFEYLNFKNQVLNNARYTSASQWQDRIINNIHDGNPNTVWQPDRILWHNKKQEFTIDLGKEIEINRFIWINGFGNNTPTKYFIETSLDNKVWHVNKSVDATMRVDSQRPQILIFDPVVAKFVRMRIVASLNDDAPGISESWVVPAKLADLDIDSAEDFLRKPFDNVSTLSTFNSLLKLLSYKGSVQVYWNKSNESVFGTETNSKISVLYDGGIHTYETVIPAGGLILQKVRFSDFIIPGNIIVKNIYYHY